MLLLIDNYDSFTYNLFHMTCMHDKNVLVKRNDKISCDEAIALKPRAIVISPGPGCPPESTGICCDLVKCAVEASIPILGICLGHQVIGQVFGGNIIRAPKVAHGKTSPIYHSDGDFTLEAEEQKGNPRVFAGISNPFIATRYHSLIIDNNGFPNNELEITAKTSDGIIMAVKHRRHNIFGVQFHPESFMSEGGSTIISNFIEIADANS